MIKNQWDPRRDEREASRTAEIEAAHQQRIDRACSPARTLRHSRGNLRMVYGGKILLWRLAIGSTLFVLQFRKSYAEEAVRHALSSPFHSSLSWGRSTSSPPSLFPRGLCVSRVDREVAGVPYVLRVCVHLYDVVAGVSLSKAFVSFLSFLSLRFESLRTSRFEGYAIDGTCGETSVVCRIECQQPFGPLSLSHSMLVVGMMPSTRCWAGWRVPVDLNNPHADKQGSEVRVTRCLRLLCFHGHGFSYEDEAALTRARLR